MEHEPEAAQLVRVGCLPLVNYILRDHNSVCIQSRYLDIVFNLLCRHTIYSVYICISEACTRISDITQSIYIKVNVCMYVPA
jgi:hypothetical protein